MQKLYVGMQLGSYQKIINGMQLGSYSPGKGGFI
jgi:hypothetical protein